MEIAGDDSRRDGSDQAALIEVCNCPIGYSGTSCEECSRGYKRANIGFYLGLCEPDY